MTLLIIAFGWLVCAATVVLIIVTEERRLVASDLLLSLVVGPIGIAIYCVGTVINQLKNIVLWDEK
jgi:hypothetical protein